MGALRWAYHRAPQLVCFLLALGMASGASSGEGMPFALAAAGFLIACVGFHALHVWQKIDDPSRE